MYRILLPTDFSTNAQNAIDYAIYLFEREPCTFYLLHAYYIVPSESGTKINAGNALKTLQNKLEATKSGQHTFESVLLTNTALSAIESTITEKDIDFVFMGTKGASALKKVLFGSVTLSVVRHINSCPIIAVPDDYDYDIPDDILFANDFNHTFPAAALKPLLEISALWDSTVNIVYIDSKKEMEDHQKFNKKMVLQYLSETRHTFFKIKKKKSISLTLSNLEKQYENIGMLTFLKTEHGFFEKLLREPIIKNMVVMTKVPLLLLPALGQ